MSTHSRTRVSGFTLVEVLVALAIGIIIVMGVVSVAHMIGQMDMSARMQGARDTIVNNIRRNAANPHAMNVSSLYAGNSNLYNCVQGSTTACQDNQSWGFTLVDSNSNIVAGNATAAFYDIDGHLCAGVTSATGQCPLEANAYFIPRCPPRGCGTGPNNNVTIEVHYAVWVAPVAYGTSSASTNPGGVSTPVVQTVNSPPVPVSGQSIYNAQ